MASTSETGHAKNTANFDELISFATGYGSAFNPSKPSIKLVALQTLSTNAKNSINAVNAALSNHGNATAAREVAFAPLNKLTTRILNALKATDASTQVEENAKSITRKIQGLRATPKKSEAQKQSVDAQEPIVKQISSYNFV